MSKAIIDPDEVRAFASELKRFNGELHGRMMSLYMRYKTLGESWQDQEQLKFAEEFERSIKNLKKFIDLANVQTPILVRKADKIDEYLSQQ